MASDIHVNFVTDNLFKSSKNFAKFCEKTDRLYKKIDTLKEIIQTRDDIFSQKKEKFKNLLDFQINKIEKEKEHYVKKSEELTTKIEETKALLASLNQNYSQLRAKFVQEKQMNENLKRTHIKLQTELKQQEEQFNEVEKNYKTVISWYENFLNIGITVEENNKVFSVYFKDDYIEKEPHAVLKKLDNDLFQVLKVSLFTNGNKHAFNDKEIVNKQELMMLLCKMRNELFPKSEFS